MTKTSFNSAGFRLLIVAALGVLLTALAAPADAQTLVNFNSPAETPGNTVNLGYNATANTTTYTIQTLWTPAQLNNANGDLTHFGFQTAFPASVSWPNVKITVGETNRDWIGMQTTLATNFTSVPATPPPPMFPAPVVCFNGPLSVATTTPDQIWRVPLTSSYPYSGLHKLMVLFEITAPTSSGMTLRVTSPPGPNYSNSYIAITGQPNQTVGTAISYFLGLGAGFTFVPQATVPSLFIQDLSVVGTDKLASGPNTVQVIVRNNGISSFSNTPFTLEYSTDGGTTFPPSQSQTFNLPSFPQLTNQTVTFTTPWVVTGAGVKNLVVRINPTIGPGPWQNSRTWIPDVDVISVQGSQFPAVGVPQTVSITLRNNGQVGLDNVPISCRYSVDGSTFVTQVFTPTTFAVGTTQSFSFTTLLTVASITNTTLTGDISPALDGDPDVTDSATRYLPLDGIHFVKVGPATPTLGASSTGSIPLATGFTSNFMCTFTKAQLDNLEGRITEFGFQQATGSGNIPTLRIWMGETTRTPSTASLLMNDNFDAVAPVQVFNGAATVTPGTDGYFRVVLTTPYDYTGLNNLAVRIELPTTGLSPSTSTAYATTDPTNFRINSTSTKVSPGTLDSGFVQGASFAIQARFNGANARVKSSNVLGGAPSLGNNTVQAVIRNVGTTDLSTTPITLEYSIDGGQTWPVSHPFTIAGLTSLTEQTVSFTTPWNVTALGPLTLAVRMPTPIGTGGAVSSRTFSVDADVVAISTTPADPLPGQPNTVSVTIRNSGAVSLNGFPLQLRYAPNVGQSAATQTFTPTTLGTPNSTETFTFTQTWAFPVAGPQTILATLLVQPAGDPDVFGDRLSRTFPSAGVNSLIFGTGTSAATLSPPIPGPASVGAVGNGSVIQMLYTASDLSGLASGAFINSVAFYKESDARSLGATTQKLKIWLRNTTDTSYAADTTYGAFATGATLVYDNQAWTMPGDIGWVEFGPFTGSTPFLYTGNSLEVTVEWDTFSTTGSQLGPLTNTLSWRYNAVSDDSRGRALVYTSTPFGTQAVIRGANASGTRRPHLRVFNATNTGPIIYTSNTLPDARPGQLYGASLASIGGGGTPYAYALVTGTLPAGITLSTAGELSGTPATTSPSDTPYVFTVSSTSGGVGNKTFSLRVPTLTVAFPMGPLYDSQAMHPYNCPLGISGGSGTYTITLTAGTLPPGLTINVPTLSISGESAPASVSATPYDFTLTIGDGNISIVRQYSILVRTAEFQVLPNALQVAIGGGTRGGNVINTYWHDSRLEAIYLESELRAAGLYNNAWLLGLSLKCAELPGRDLSAFRIRIRSTTENTHSGNFASQNYFNSFGPTLVTAASFTVNDWRYFNFALPYQYTGGNLMIDFTEDGTTFATGGDIFMRDTGTQLRHLRGFGDSTQGWPYTLQNNGGRGTSVPAVKFSVATPLISTFTGLGAAIELLPYSRQLIATGGTGNYTWTITSGSLPNGLTLSGTGSAITPASIFGSPDSGTSNPGIYNVTLTLSDGLTTINHPTTITVSVLSQVIFNPVTLAPAMEFIPYTMTTPLTASAGSLSYSFTVSPTSQHQLPNGMTLNGATGIISGTPASGTAGTRNITFTVDDGYSTANRTVQLVIQNHPLEWRGTSLPTATATQTYSGQLDAIGGIGGRVYSVDVSSAAPLPPGLFLAGSTGLITGTPGLASVGTHNITFKVQDIMNNSQLRMIPFVIIAPDPILITTASLPYAEVGTAYSTQLAATGGTLNYTYSLDTTSPPLPAGFTLSTSGLLTGNPAPGTDGRYPLVLRLSDTLQVSTKSMTLTVAAAAAQQVRITEVAPVANYIEITNIGTRHIDVSGWRVRAWIGGNTPATFAFDTLPGASLLMRGEILVLNVGGTAGGTWPTFATGTAWSATAQSSIAVGLFDSFGNLMDFVAIGSVTPSDLLDSPTVNANLPAFKTTTIIANGSDNYSLGASTWTGQATGTQGTRNPGLTAVALGFIKGDLRPARIGSTYSDAVLGFGGVPPYTYAIVAPSASWLSMSASTGIVSSIGNVPAGAPASIFADVSVSDALSATVTRTIEISVVSASATPLHHFTASPAGGQTAAGTTINMSINYGRESNAPSITGFALIVETPAPTVAVADLRRVLRGAAVPATTTVLARRLSPFRILLLGVADGTPAATLITGEIAVARFVLPSQATTGLYAVNLLDPGVDSTGSRLSDATLGSLNIADFKPQDVNRDNAIDVVDVQQTVNIILSLFTPTYPGQGDANVDNAVDVVDVQTVVNCILLGGC